MKLARIGVAVAALAALAAFVGVGLPEGAQGTSDPTTHGITVSGNGKVTTVPDRAQFCFDVENHAGTADAASAANAAGMQKVIDALRDAGVASKDMQTVNLSVSPLYNDDGSKVLGYVATNSVCATTKVADAGSIVDTGLGAGADRVSGPTLTKADTDKLYADALRAAVADARARGGARRGRRRQGRPSRVDDRGVRAFGADPLRADRRARGHPNRARHAGHRGRRDGDVRNRLGGFGGMLRAVGVRAPERYSPTALDRISPNPPRAV